jgi:hypothetical protein
MSKPIRVPDYVHERATAEAEERGETVGNVVFEWMVAARYEERDGE